MQRLSGLDAQFLYTETPTLHMHTLKLAILDPSPWAGVPSHDVVRDEIGRRLHLLPPFRQRLVSVPGHLHHPVWIEDPDFDLDYHVRRTSVPAPGGRRELDRAIADIAGWPLDRARPLWQLYVLEGLAEGRIGVLVKIHHAAADGVAATHLLANAMTTSATDGDPEPEPPGSRWRPDAPPGGVRLVREALVARARDAADLPVLLRRTGGRLRKVRTRQRAEPVATPRPILDTPKVSFNGALTPHRSFATTTLALPDARAVRRAFGVTVNDVVLATVAGALRRYLIERNELPAKPLVAGVPVSSDDEATVARLGGNRVSNMFTSLATDIEDPVERLRAIHAVTAEAKEVHNLLGATMMQDWVQYTPPRLFSWAMRQYSQRGVADRHPPPINLVVSNVPGPRETLYAAGARLAALYSVGPVLEGVGLNITVWSYLDDLDVGILACRELLPAPEVLAGHLRESMAELCERATTG